MANKDPRDVMAEALVEMMSKDGIDKLWSKPWTILRQKNAATGRAYRGMNALFLSLLCMGRNYDEGLWLTWKEMKALGGHPLNDEWEKSTLVIWIRPSSFTPKDADGEPVLNDDDEPIVKHYWKRGLHQVWNVAQTTVDPAKYAKHRAPVRNNTPDAEIEEWVNAVVHGNGCSGIRNPIGHSEAAYIPALDVITIPGLNLFTDRDSYYATLFHEMGHSTGSKKRLARGLDTRFGSPAYAEEELVAEFTAAFLGGEFGLTGQPRHAAYLAHWVQRCQERPRLAWDAVSSAKRAVDYMKAAAESQKATEPKVEQQKAA